MEIDKPSGLERRGFPRLKENIFLFYRLHLSSSDEFKAVIYNISGGGLMFETERDIPPGTKLLLEIYQPIKQSKNMILSVSVLAKIIWQRKIEKDDFEKGENKYKVGVEFTEIKEEDRQRIAKYVEEQISGE